MFRVENIPTQVHWGNGLANYFHWILQLLRAHPVDRGLKLGEIEKRLGLINKFKDKEEEMGVVVELNASEYSDLQEVFNIADGSFMVIEQEFVDFVKYIKNLKDEK